MHSAIKFDNSPKIHLSEDNKSNSYDSNEFEGGYKSSNIP